MGFFSDNIVMDYVTIVVVICGLVYYYLTSMHSYWKKLNIPYIKPEIFFGNIKDIVTFKKNQPEKFTEFYTYFKKLGYSCGGIFELGTPVLFVCTAEVTRDILLKSFSSFHDRGLPYDEHFDPLSANLILLDGQKWKYIRSKLTPAFSSGKLKTMVASFISAGSPLMNIWRTASENNEFLDIRELMARYTTDVIGQCAFGLELHSFNEEESRFRRLGKQIFAPSKKEKILQIIRNTYPWIYKTFKLRLFPEELSDYFVNILRETMDYREKNGTNKNDFLNYLMQLKDGRGIYVTNEFNEKEEVSRNTSEGNVIELTEGVIAAQAFIFFLAGFETSSTTLSFCMYELAVNPEMQKRVQEEIDVALKKHGGITIDFLQDLKYMEQVFQETLRMYPPAPALLRICTEAYKLPDSNAVVPRGTRVFIPIYSMHHDPDYFPNPEKFDPERFSSENIEKIIPYSYLPFGNGPRICIGMRFAMLEMKTILSLLLSKYTLLKCERTKPIRIEPRSFILTAVDGIWLKTAKRE